MSLSELADLTGVAGSSLTVLIKDGGQPRLPASRTLVRALTEHRPSQAALRYAAALAADPESATSPDVADEACEPDLPKAA